MPKIIKLSGDDLANLDAEGARGVTKKTKNLQMNRFEAFLNFIDEFELEKEGQGKINCFVIIDQSFIVVSDYYYKTACSKKRGSVSDVRVCIKH